MPRAHATGGRRTARHLKTVRLTRPRNARIPLRKPEQKLAAPAVRTEPDIPHQATAAKPTTPKLTAAKPTAQVVQKETDIPRRAPVQKPETAKPAAAKPVVQAENDEPIDPIAVDDPAPKPVTLRRAHRLVMPAPLTGSAASLERQNERTEAEGLERILDDDDLEDRIARRALVAVPVSAALAINPDLPSNRRYCRPWTARFLADLARAHQAKFHSPLEVSSAVRTVDYQKRLMLINGNAAAAEGDIVSPHLTGATVDIAKSSLTQQEIAWMRTRLLPLQQAGKIDVEEEFQQSCFHITVYKTYLPAPRRNVPAANQLASRAPHPEADQLRPSR